ncbi:GNAT family N-acetyltransferase [uncultured Vibrio sp.]|uniref:GNAT family N-acetyltransferase n=1 Tax=uncultured Vibrio sp. TaxID=114054 RepID=UPI0025D08203|nr:GNAT family N-acetyltransferase [uncultured Vibrio sp.]
MDTQRLIIREWNDSDLTAFEEMSTDPLVMTYFPSTLSKKESHDLADRIRNLIALNGYGFWAVELKSTSEFIGFVGLHKQEKEGGIPNAPFIEIGWRLSSKHWGKGYATEAANKALEYAFEELDQPSVYAFTTLTNEPSQQVMRKLGMVNTHQDFDHPKLPKGHALERHCLYQITRENWALHKLD